MNIDRKKVREQFAAYTRKYDPADPKIALKITHTYRVADHCEMIGSSIGLSGEELDFAWLSGMLHDIGRFEQVRRFNTFMDSESVDHAEFGADLLFGEDNLIRGYVEEERSGGEADVEDGSGLLKDKAGELLIAGTAEGTEAEPSGIPCIDGCPWDKVLERVIRQHNKYRIDESVKGRELVFCNILRDADKVDILRVNVETPMEDIYNVSRQELFSSGVSEAVMDQVREHHAVLRDVMVSPAEHLIGHIALAFELVYPKSWELAREQGYLYQMFEFPTTNESTKKALRETRRELEEFYRV